MRRILLVLFAVLQPAIAPAQAPARLPSIDTLPRPAANPADVQSLDAIVAALYDVISGPAGKERDWNRFRSLFVPNARLIPTGAVPTGGARATMLSADDYAQRAGPGLQQSGFFEVELNRVTEQYGNIAHLFSTYESRRTADKTETPFSRGINSIQALKDGNRWWIVSVFWDAERPGSEIPAKYLPGAKR